MYQVNLIIRRVVSLNWSNSLPWEHLCHVWIEAHDEVPYCLVYLKDSYGMSFTILNGSNIFLIKLIEKLSYGTFKESKMLQRD